MPEKLLLRVSDAAEALSVSRSKLYEMIGQGIIPAIRIGGVIRVPMEVLREMIRQSIQPESDSLPPAE